MSTAARRRALTDPPGGLLMWIVVALELLTFSMVFGVLAVFRVSDAAEFCEGRALLDPRFGLALTLTLLTSGWLVAEAVHAHRTGRLGRARGFYAGGIALGFAFVGLKIYDYVGKSAAGLDLSTDFGSAYILGTGFHFAHVLVGLTMLCSVALRLGRRELEDEELAIAGTALFWHMCDIAWLFLFPLYYLGNTSCG